MGEYALGQGVPRSEDPRLLRGGGRYVSDVTLPRMAHAVLLRSPHAHAKILSIDTAPALALPGVVAVLTHAEWAASGYRDIPAGGAYTRPDGSPQFTPPSPPLAKDRVRRVGEGVAFVVAETLNQALDAAEAVAVDYEPLASVTDTAAAAEPGAPLVWDDCAGNVCYVYEAGDKAAVEEGLAQAKHVVKERFIINRVAPSSMEPRGCVAAWDGSEESFTVYTPVQGIHPYRAQLARLVKVSEGSLRVISGDVGGSFGMKSAVYPEIPLCMLAARSLGRPIKWMSNRAEAFLSDSHGRDNVVDVSLALDEQGKFLALEIDSLANLGCCLMAGTVNPPVNNIGSVAGVYTTPAICVKVTGLFSHTNPTRPYRGAGRPEAAYMIERIIDMAADKLGIDAADLRRRNTISPDAMPYKTGLLFKYDSGEFEKNLTMALDLARYDGFAARRAESRKRGKLRGIGMSNTIEKAAGAGVEGAELRFDRSGGATIFSGSVTAGQGHETVYKQIVCDKFGLAMDDVKYVWGDSDKVAFGHGSGGSRSATLGGGAVLQASEKVLAKAMRIAAHALEVAPDAVKFTDGVFSTSGSNQTFTIKDVAKLALNPKSLPDGMEPGLIEASVYTAKTANYPNGCHICELEIDEETGVIDVVGYSVVDDVGTVMNPLLLKGQIHGGIAQGLGQILMEDLRYDADSGQLLTASFLDYGMPRARDFSHIEVVCNPVATKTNPLGVKGAGEAGTVGSMPAVANAVVDALSVYGIRHLDMPTTPERVWRAIQAAKNGKQIAG
ncbi:MAG TPA: xanthine dehydrogenase family protein molybdopterin-binding subunit [Alphaproteobacteria bacterium]